MVLSWNKTKSLRSTESYFWEAKLKLVFRENDQDMAAIKKMKAVGRKAIDTKLSKRLGIYHDVAATMDPRVREIEDEEKKNVVFDYLYGRICGHQSKGHLSSDDENGNEVNINICYSVRTSKTFNVLHELLYKLIA